MGPLMGAGLPLIKSVLTSLAKNVLLALGVTATASAPDPIQKKIYGSGMTTLIISKEEMNDILEILQESGLPVKGVHKTIKNEANEQKDRFLPLLLNTLSTSLFGSILPGKGVT